MKRLFWALILFVIAVLIGIQVANHPGYVTINTDHYQIEMRLWVVIVALVLLYAIFAIVIRLFRLGASIPSKWQRWRSSGRQQKANRKTEQALAALIQGEFAAAKKQLAKYSERAAIPLFNWLAAAVAAQYAGQHAERDRFIATAEQHLPDESITIQLVYVRLLMQAREFAQANIVLDKLFAEKRTVTMVKMQLEIAAELNDWRRVLDCIDELKAMREYDEATYLDLIKTANLALWQSIASVSQLQQAWDALPTILQHDAEVLNHYLLMLTTLQQRQLVSKQLVSSLKRIWLPELADIIAKLELVEPKRLLNVAASWTAEYTSDAKLYYFLGYLAEQAEAVEQAEQHYQRSLELRPSMACYAAMAKLLESRGEMKQSYVYYRKGLRLLSDGSSRRSE